MLERMKPNRATHALVVSIVALVVAVSAFTLGGAQAGTGDSRKIAKLTHRAAVLEARLADAEDTIACFGAMAVEISEDGVLVQVNGIDQDETGAHIWIPTYEDSCATWDDPTDEGFEKVREP